jgi:cobalt-zinc-cadmium resistance protein CzcA
VAERLNNIMGDLPAGITGGMAPITTPLGEMFMFTIESDTLSLEEKREPAGLGDPARPAHRARRGRCQCAGWRGARFEVVPDLLKLAANEVTLEALRQVIAANNRNDGAGRLDEGDEVAAGAERRPHPHPGRPARHCRGDARRRGGAVG